MPFGIDDAIMLGGAALGSGAGSLFQDRLNRRASNAQRDWEGYMFSHRYQAQVGDLMAAGLNPMLAYMQSPGGVPSSSAATVDRPDVVGSFNSTRATSAQVANVNADTLKKAAETENTDMDTMLKGGMVYQVAAQTSAALASADQSRALAEQIRVSIPKITVEIEELRSRVEKNKADTELAQSLVVANQYLNSLRMAQARLEGRKAALAEQDIALRDPKVKSLGSASDDARRIYGQSSVVSDVMQNFYDMVNPFRSKRR